MSVSCIIITLNESYHIEDCIKSVQEVVDEIIVVDAESVDDTAAKAKSLGAKTIVKSWEGYGQARNYGASQAKHDWILSIDADERLSSDLIFSIKSLELELDKVYAFNRLTNYCGQWIKHGSWYPEWKLRLYNRKQIDWNLNAVHETLIKKGNCEQVKLEGDLLHYAYTSHEELVVRLAKYAKLIIQERLDKGPKSSWAKKNLSPTFHFLKSYVFRLGFLDGKAGYKIATAIMDYTRLKYRDI